MALDLQDRRALRVNKEFEMKFSPKSDDPVIDRISIRGAIDDNGKRYHRVSIREHNGRVQKSSWFSRSSVLGSGANVKKALAAAGITLFDDTFAELREKFEIFKNFEDGPVCHRVGWSGEAYALPNGEVIGRSLEKRPAVLFAPRSDRVGSSGTHTQWLDNVAQPLTGHWHGEFCLMLALTAPLLRFDGRGMNFGVELAGDGALGKTTLLKCAASVVGPVGGQNGNYVISMNATANSIDALMPDFCGLPMILDEFNSMTLASGASAGRTTVGLIFQLAEGQTKRRYGQSDAGQSRFVMLSSTNRPWHEFGGGVPTEMAKAAADRMMTITVGGKGRAGIFRKALMGDETIASLCTTLSRATAENYGTALPHFVDDLVSRMREGGAASISDYLDQQLSRFRAHVVKRGLEVDERVIHSFGLIYAAGRLAVANGALPDSFQPMRSTIQALRRFLRTRKRIETPLEMLVRIATDGKALDLRKRRDATKEDISNAPCILLRQHDGDELVMTADQVSALPIERAALLKDPDVRPAIKHENDRKTIQRQVAYAERRRVLCFRLDRLIAGK